jgi:adenine-specific DNA-methyltransferase
MDSIKEKMPLSPDHNEERLAILKELMPDIFTNEGKLNINELKKVVDPELVNETERYEFRWFGKSRAKREAFTPTNATLVYDEDRSVNPEITENIIIEGENLAVLKLLSNAYREKVKCIYIDPPYNKDKDFVYTDVWKSDKKDYWEDIETLEKGIKIDTNTESNGRFHSNWLNMLYSRLLIARQLLSKDGIIFISIDDAEIHHLKKIADLVFGEENFYSQLIIRANSRGQTFNQIAKTHEYILVYTKSIDGDLKELEKGEENSDLNLEDDIGKFNIRELRNRNPKFGKHNRPNLFYPIYVDPTIADKDGFYKVSLTKSENYSEMIEPFNSKGVESCWRWGKEKFENNNQENTLFSNVIGKQKQDGTYGIYEKYRKTTYKAKSIWNDNKFLTETGTIDFKSLGFDGEFDFPKPVELIKRCIELSTDENDLILDFFAGAGTTGHSVQSLASQSGCNRKFIIVQIPEAIDEDHIAYKAGYKKISDITIERNKRVIEKIIEEKKTEHPDLFTDDKKDDSLQGLGFKVFKLQKSNFPRTEFAPDPEKSEEENVELLKKYIRDKEAQMVTAFNKDELITEILIKKGYELNYTVTAKEEFKKNELFHVTDGNKETLICLDGALDKETVEYFKQNPNENLIVLERALDTTKKWNLKHYMGDNFVAF